jgi:hypothetical protein
MVKWCFFAETDKLFAIQIVIKAHIVTHIFLEIHMRDKTGVPFLL